MTFKGLEKAVGVVRRFPDLCWVNSLQYFEAISAFVVFALLRWLGSMVETVQHVLLTHLFYVRVRRERLLEEPLAVVSLQGLGIGEKPRLYYLYHQMALVIGSAIWP